MTGLIRPTSAKAWELRRAWATGQRVSCTLDADIERVEGFVSTVAASDAYFVLGGLHVPLERVLAVHLPSRLGDSSVAAGEPWRSSPRQPEPQRERLPV